jgi:SAM-dependent methyltransferase
VLNRGIKSLAEKVLPSFVLRWLDPVQATIEAEVRRAAEMMTPGQIVLDAGAGESRHRRHFQGVRYIALDSAWGNPDWDYSRLDVCGNLENIPLRSNSVECILCMVVLEHTRNPGTVLAEFARVLKPGGTLTMVVPFLWEEHQAPHDYFRFTRYGIRSLLEPLPLRTTLLRPMGGFFLLCGRRCVNLLGFFQGGWRWPLFVLLAPFFGLLFPIILYFLDRLDRKNEFSLGFQVRATREAD